MFCAVTAATSAAATATVSPYEADPAGWLGWPGDGDAGWAMSGEETATEVIVTGAPMGAW